MTLPRLVRIAGISVCIVASAACLARGAQPGPSIVNHPNVVVAASRLGWKSANWSGYAKTGGPYTQVSATWTVPAVAPTGQATFSSSWVGIDGFTNNNLIQTGTEQDYYSGAAHYMAWWEILPAAEVQVLTVNPGDRMTASIVETTVQPPEWVITISDTTTRQTFNITEQYYGPGASVEWIQEAPIVNGSLAALAHYDEVTFDPGGANNASPRLRARNSGQMVQGTHKVSTPSAPDVDTDGFNVAFGASQPAAPRS